MDSTALARDIRAEVYTDLQHLIHSLVGKFCARYGTDFDDYLSLAHLTFLKCFAKFDPSQSSFTTFIHWKIWYRMMEQRRTDARTYRVSKIASDVDVEMIPRKGSPFSFVDLIDELSEDSRMVVQLVFGRDVQLALQSRNANGPHTARSAIREVLEDLGWTRQRIVETFDEIAAALRS